MAWSVVLAEEGNGENQNIEKETQNVIKSAPSNSIGDAKLELHLSEDSQEGFEEDIHTSLTTQQAKKTKCIQNSSSEYDTNTPDRKSPKHSLVSSLQRKRTRTSLDYLSDD